MCEKYIVVGSKNKQTIIDRVNVYLKKGYSLNGDIFLSTQDCGCFCQSIVCQSLIFEGLNKTTKQGPVNLDEWSRMSQAKSCHRKGAMPGRA